MAKTIPVRKGTQDRLLAESEERAQKAKLVYSQQNAAARDAIDRMQSLLIRISRRQFRSGGAVSEIPNDAIWNNALYMAVEILKDLGYMDIRVADFTWPADMCIECGGRVTTKRRARK